MKERCAEIQLVLKAFIPGTNSLQDNRKNLSGGYISIDTSIDEFFVTYRLDRLDIKTQFGDTATGLENSGILNDA